MKMFRCLLVLALLVPVTAFAEMGGDMKDCPMMDGKGGMPSGKMAKMHGGMKGGADCKELGMYIKMKKELGLTDAQVTRLKAIKTERMKAQVKTEADMKLARIDMMDKMGNDTPDFAAMREKIKQVNALELGSKLAMVDAREKAYAVLTPDQQKKLPELMKECHKGMMMKKGDKKK